MKTPLLRWGLVLSSLILLALMAGPAAAAPPEGALSAPSDDGDSGTTAVAVNRQAPSYRVPLSPTGAFTGQLSRLDSVGTIVPAQGVRVRFVRDGSVVAVAEPNVNGTFQATGLSPGQYSLLVDGSDGMAVLSIIAERARPTISPAAAPFELLLTAPVDTPTIRAIALREVPGLSAPATASPLPAAPVVMPPAVVPPPGPVFSEAVSYQVSPSNDFPNNSPVLRISDDGEIPGAVKFNPASGQFVPVGDVSAFIIRNGAVLSELPVDAEGNFHVQGLAEGIYSFVVAGPGGFGAMAVKVVAAPPVVSEASQPITNRLVPGAARQSDRTRPVALLQGQGMQLSVVPPGDMAAFFPSSGPAVPPPAPPLGPPLPPPFAAGMPFGGGAGGGFGGGGGGLFGGGGLIGGLIGAGVGAGITAAVLSDDDDDGDDGDGDGDGDGDDGGRRPPSSPFIPR